MLHTGKLRPEWNKVGACLNLNGGLMSPLGRQNENRGICSQMVSENSVIHIDRSDMSSSGAEKLQKQRAWAKRQVHRSKWAIIATKF